MKIYLASRYSRNQELKQYKAALEEHGHVVNSRWLEGYEQRHGTENAELVEQHRDLSPIPEIGRLFAEDDVEDVLESEAIICFTEQTEGASSRGGRHVEFGIALGFNLLVFLEFSKRIIVIGPRENVFYCLEDVEHYSSWYDFRTHCNLIMEDN